MASSMRARRTFRTCRRIDPTAQCGDAPREPEIDFPQIAVGGIMKEGNRRRILFSVVAVSVKLGGDARAAEKDAAQRPEANKPTEAEVETWRQKMIATPQPKVGCFTASYPD